jgi:hypothetical protein
VRAKGLKKAKLPDESATALRNLQKNSLDEMLGDLF